MSRPRQNNFYLSFDHDIVRLIHVNKVKNRNDPESDKTWEVDVTLIAGLTDKGEVIWWNEKMGPTNGDLEELETDTAYPSLEIVHKRNFKNYMKYFFGDW